MSFLSFHHVLIQLLHEYGNVVLGIVVGLECVGLPLPGETLLIAAGIIAGTTQHLNIFMVVISAALGAIVGQLGGYWIGWGIGFRLLRRYGRYIGLNDRRMAYGRALFRKHGEKVVVVSRFVVLLRTLAGLLAGANHMAFGRFLIANVAGSVAWSALYGVGAYMLGHAAKDVAGPVAIGFSALLLLGLGGTMLYVRRREHRLFSAPMRARVAK
ncbi:MAG TPA: DedA family protein [Acetobacteraceae bacterium]|nr:DedA family protein [Acetobacteraceae bacterium]